MADNRGSPPEYHHNKCSFNQTDGVILCDCDILMKHPETWDSVMHNARKTPKGIPYTIKEAKYAAYNNKMDIYHKELILWLCDELEKVRKK